jgi:hypothetical protein
MTITFSLSLALIPYGLIAAFVAAFAIFNIHHLVHYGATTRTSYVITAVFLFGIAVISILTWYQLRGVDWKQPISLTPKIPVPSLMETANQNLP